MLEELTPDAKVSTQIHSHIHTYIQLFKGSQQMVSVLVQTLHIHSQHRSKITCSKFEQKILSRLLGFIVIASKQCVGRCRFVFCLRLTVYVS